MQTLSTYSQPPATFLFICIGELQSLHPVVECKDKGFDPEKKFNLTSLVRSVNCHFTLKIAVFFFFFFCFSFALGSIRDA